ncbi:hypothetical protein U1Q18_039876 [Sarracenia purpurea var. burkii]
MGKGRESIAGASGGRGGWGLWVEWCIERVADVIRKMGEKFISYGQLHAMVFRKASKHGAATYVSTFSWCFLSFGTNGSKVQRLLVEGQRSLVLALGSASHIAGLRNKVCFGSPASYLQAKH